MASKNDQTGSVDIWGVRDAGTGSLPNSNHPELSFTTLTGIEPLGSQMGSFTKKTCPDTMAKVLFGQSQPGDGTPIVQTYAVLDAAKAQGLYEMLNAEGVSSECLFQGAAYRELREVAPWVVRLDQNDSLVRCLFSSGSLPSCLWDREAGIFLRTPMSLVDLRGHLRRFTRLRDSDRNWSYFRFWEPEVMRTFARNHTLLRAFWDSFLPEGQIVVTDPLLNEALVITRSIKDEDATRAPVLLTEPMKDILRHQRIRIFSRQIVRDMAVEIGQEPRENLEKVHKVILDGIGKGLREDMHLRRFAELCLTADQQHPGWRDFDNVGRTFSADHSPSRLLAELEYDLSDIERKTDHG